jgi:phytoene desaturase
MNTPRTTAVIGSGVGGITTAIFLARQGFDVTVYEKNGFPGGRCSRIVRDGHRFDAGATIFLMPSLYRKVFRALGLSLEECFEYKPLKDLYGLHFGDGTLLRFSTDRAVLEHELEAIEQGAGMRSRKLVGEGYRFFEMAYDQLLGRNYTRLSQFITLRNGLLLVKLKTYIRHMSYIRRFFRNENLQKAFTFQNIYVGQSPYGAPALFSMLAAAELTEGSLFPIGGMYRITEKLLELANNAGVKFEYNKPVRRIMTAGKQVTGLLFEDGSEAHPGLVVANADLPYVYRELLPDRRLSRRIERKQFSCAALVFHWGLDKVYPELHHHTVFLSAGYETNLDRIFRDHSLSDEPSFYIHAPVRTDPTAAPAGCDTLSVIVPCGNLDPKHPQDWTALRERTRKSIIRRLAEAGLKDLEDHIKFEISYTPENWSQVFHVSRGGTFGSLGHQIFQMGFFRPHNRHRKYRNLYFAGGSTHPGSGVPLVLMSGMLTSERIVKEHA